MGMILPEGWISNVHGREIAVWGTGLDAPDALTAVCDGGTEVSFFISRDWVKVPSYIGKRVLGKDVLDRERHYVVIGSTRYYDEIRQELLELGFKAGTDFAAYTLRDSVWPVRRDRRENGVFVGRLSYFPNSWRISMADPEHDGMVLYRNHIASIGRFTSINGSAQIQADHTMRTLSTSYVWELLDRDKRGDLSKKYADRFVKANRVKIGNDVWIGANAFINVSKVKEIGDGAIIGAGAVVIEDVPPYAVVVGVPGKVKKYRYTPEQIECLLRVKWWDWTDEEINENAELFYNPDMFFKKFM